MGDIVPYVRLWSEGDCLKYLKKQPVALLIALVLMAGSLFFGVNRSVSEEVTAVREQFYSGVFDPSVGYVRPGIHGQLVQRTTAALRMLSIGEHSHSGELAEAGAELQGARGALLDLLTIGAGPSALFQADQDLTVAAERYFALLHPLVLEAEGEDLQALESANSTMLSAARVIETSRYNETVGVFHRTVLGQFPMNFLRALVFVEMPELFA